MADTVELIAPCWPAPARVRALATTRTGGVSTGRYASLNLGSHVGDEPRAVSTNRARLVEIAGLPAEPLWLNQVHGIAVAEAGIAGATPAADAMIAAQAGQVCAVLSADCLPILWCDDAGTRVAATHAGWRGLAAGVLEATIAALVRAGSPPASLMAWIGPGISAAAYEVGEEVRAAFLGADPTAASGFKANARGRWQLDLPWLARQRLQAAGVSRVFGGDLCTHANPTRFFSHRRDGNCGRQATLIWLAPPAGAP